MSIFDTHFMTGTKPPINQINIVRHIARNGKQSKVKLADKKKGLNKYWSEINDSVKSLLDKKLIVEDPGTKDKKEKFFNLTTEGFRIAIADNHLELPKDNPYNYNPITSEQFWKHLSNIDDDYSIQEIKKIAKISNLFDKIILGIDKTHTIPETFLMNINNKDLNQYGSKPKKYQDAEEISMILRTISKYKPMKLSRLLQRLESTNIEKHDLDDLVIGGLLVKIDDAYDLSHAGLIELLFFIYRDSNTELFWNRLKNYKTNKPKSIDYQEFGKSKDSQAIQVNKELDRLRLKYVHLLPDIFNGGNFQKLCISFYEVVVLLMKLYKNLDDEPEIGHNTERDYQYLEEYQTLQRLDKIRQNFQYRKMSEHLDISEEIEKNQITITHRLSILQAIILVNMEEKLQIDNHSIKRKITFDFYSIYKAYWHGWNNTELSKLDIRRWHDQEIRTLLDFSQNHIKNIELSLK